MKLTVRLMGTVQKYSVDSCAVSTGDTNVAPPHMGDDRYTAN